MNRQETNKILASLLGYEFFRNSDSIVPEIEVIDDEHNMLNFNIYSSCNQLIDAFDACVGLALAECYEIDSVYNLLFKQFSMSMTYGTKNAMFEFVEGFISEYK